MRFLLYYTHVDTTNPEERNPNPDRPISLECSISPPRRQVGALRVRHLKTKSEEDEEARRETGIRQRRYNNGYDSETNQGKKKRKEKRIKKLAVFFCITLLWFK